MQSNFADFVAVVAEQLLGSTREFGRVVAEQPAQLAYPPQQLTAENTAVVVVAVAELRQLVLPNCAAELRSKLRGH